MYHAAEGFLAHRAQTLQMTCDPPRRLADQLLKGYAANKGYVNASLLLLAVARSVFTGQRNVTPNVSHDQLIGERF